MTVTAKALIEGQFAANTATTYYTATGVKTIIDKFTAFNSDAATATLNVYIVASGGSAGDSNAVVKAVSLTTGASRDFTEMQNHILNSGDFIAVTASVASKISIRASGREIS